jgi:uncharacterized protein YydD (DUF2326 family)
VAVQLDPASIKVVVGADSNLILQAISNLLSNAVKFFPSGGEVFVKVKNLGTMGRLSVCDQGPLAFLSGTDAFGKYKQVSAELVTLRSDITSLERQRAFLYRLQELRTEIRTLTEERGRLQSEIEGDVETQNADKMSLFSTIRLFFNEIVEEVVDRKALLSVSPNKEGHLEFRAEILDESGNATSADLGHTYRKLLCVAFDMAVLRAHLPENFPRFVYHDGVLESLDDRKKENLLTVIRRYTSLGVQSIITLIDSDLPARAEGGPVFFDDSEIVLLLHDEGENGRLFRMPGW